jgi:uncharacterized protein involved in exopolysaccharide biosynthesis
MSSPSNTKGSELETPSHGKGEHLVYVLEDPAFRGASHSQISLRELWEILWRGRLGVIAMTFLFAVASVAYALLATEWFRAEVLLAPAEEKSTPSFAGQLGGQLGGLAALAGVSIGGGDSSRAVATLRSREFAREFIEELDLLPVFFAREWDSVAESWRGKDKSKWPEMRDAVKYFHENVLSVSEEVQTGLVTVGVEWTDPTVAAVWADRLVEKLNAKLRERALREANANVEYLQNELTQTGVISLQQTISRLLETELQKLMLARGNEEFAFIVIDPAEAPKRRARPKRAFIAVIGTILGGMLGVFCVLVGHAVRPDPSCTS